MGGLQSSHPATHNRSSGHAERSVCLNSRNQKVTQEAQPTMPSSATMPQPLARMSVRPRLSAPLGPGDEDELDDEEDFDDDELDDDLDDEDDELDEIENWDEDEDEDDGEENG